MKNKILKLAFVVLLIVVAIFLLTCCGGQSFEPEPEVDASQEPEADAGQEPEVDAGQEPEADAGSECSSVIENVTGGDPACEYFCDGPGTWREDATCCCL